MKFSIRPLLLASVCLAAGISGSQAADIKPAAAPSGATEDVTAVDMHLVASGAMRKLGGYMPQLLKLTADKPADLKKAPEMTAPMYGSIHFGAKSYLIALDEPADKDGVLYVDANNNGDLTDDPAPTWKKQVMNLANGSHLTQYFGNIQLPIGTGEKSLPVSLGAYRFDRNDPNRRALKDTFLYYSDYAMDGHITLGGATYHAMLSDDTASGDFRGKAGPRSGVRLLIDINGDGKFDPRFEVFDARKPFNIKGTTWELADLSGDGSFKISKSGQTVAELPAPPDLSPGKNVIAFTATTTEGKEIHFPSDYKGRVVLLDFWATWCGPCMGEVPGLVTAYNKFHPQGVDVLGISLDQPNAADKVKSVTAEHAMTWPQVYDGKFWQARIAQLYGIQSIPAPILVDGDTGKILAAGGQLRGGNLDQTLRKALDDKGIKAQN